MEIKGSVAHLDAADRKALGIEYPVVALRHLALGGDLCPQERRTELLQELYETRRLAARLYRGLHALALSGLAMPMAAVPPAEAQELFGLRPTAPSDIQARIERAEDIAVTVLRYEIERYTSAQGPDSV